MRRPPVKTALSIYSTWPFADGFPWDEELVKGNRRALSTHGPTLRPEPHRARPIPDAPPKVSS